MTKLLLMEFMTGLDGDRYQEIINGVVTRWFDLDVTLLNYHTMMDVVFRIV